MYSAHFLLVFCPEWFFSQCVLPKPFHFSPLYFAPNVFFFHCSLPRMYFFGMCFAETFPLFSNVFCPECFFFHCSLPRMHFFVMCFAASLTLCSIVFCPKRHFSLMYFAKTFTLLLYCIFPQLSFFCIGFFLTCFFLCFILPKSLYVLSPMFFFAGNVFFRNISGRNLCVLLHYILPQILFVSFFFVCILPRSLRYRKRRHFGQKTKRK